MLAMLRAILASIQILLNPRDAQRAQDAIDIRWLQ